MNELAYDYIEDIPLEEHTYGLENEEEAIVQIYEYLFDGALESENPKVYEALRYLLWSKRMHHFYDEMLELSKEFREIQKGEIE